MCLDANTEVPKQPPYQKSGIWMQISSLTNNSSLQNTPRYQFSLKSGDHSQFDDFVGGHFENKNDPECNFHHYQSIPHFKITLDINFH